MTSTLMTATTEDLQRVLYIWYPVQFLSNPEVYALLDFGSKVNIITPVYAAKLGFVTQKPDIGT